VVVGQVVIGSCTCRHAFLFSASHGSIDRLKHSLHSVPPLPCKTCVLLLFLLSCVRSCQHQQPEGR
jgi:hypothetical protein